MVDQLMKEWAYEQDTEACVKIVNNGNYRTQLSPTSNEVLTEEIIARRTKSPQESEPIKPKKPRLLTSQSPESWNDDKPEKKEANATHRSKNDNRSNQKRDIKKTCVIDLSKLSKQNKAKVNKSPHILRSKMLTPKVVHSMPGQRDRNDLALSQLRLNTEENNTQKSNTN